MTLWRAAWTAAYWRGTRHVPVFPWLSASRAARTRFSSEAQARATYEFGCKVSVATQATMSRGGQFVCLSCRVTTPIRREMRRRGPKGTLLKGSNELGLLARRGEQLLDLDVKAILAASTSPIHYNQVSPGRLQLARPFGDVAPLLGAGQGTRLGFHTVVVEPVAKRRRIDLENRGVIRACRGDRHMLAGARIDDEAVRHPSRGRSVQIGCARSLFEIHRYRRLATGTNGFAAEQGRDEDHPRCETSSSRERDGLLPRRTNGPMFSGRLCRPRQVPAAVEIA